MVRNDITCGDIKKDDKSNPYTESENYKRQAILMTVCYLESLRDTCLERYCLQILHIFFMIMMKAHAYQRLWMNTQIRYCRVY